MDVRISAHYRKAESLYKRVRQPGTGQISDASEIHVSPSSELALFTGVFADAPDRTPSSRVCQIEIASGDIRVLTFGPNNDRLPKFSPDGQYVGFLSDRHEAGNFQLHILDPGTGSARATPFVEGWVEYLHWSPDGRRILLGVAGRGADVASAQGAVNSKHIGERVSSWMPAVETGHEDYRWRHVWVYDLVTNRVKQVSRGESNIWEAAWCGSTALAAVVSSGPQEGLWYSARLHIIDIESGVSREIYSPQHQLGVPTASPSGKLLALVEALCSDRWLVAGNLLLIDTNRKSIQRLDTRGVDVTYAEWRSDRELLIAGHRDFETVVGLFDALSGKFAEMWSSRDLTTGGRYVTVAGCYDPGDCMLVGENFARAPEIAVIRGGEYRLVKSFDLGYADVVKAIEAVERLSWTAPDGLEIHGWLLLPTTGSSPYPLVMNIHGGPVWQWRPVWLGRAGLHVLMLVEAGYAVFFPNPRGSTGRGQEFAQRVLGEMGGADTYDYLSGLEYLVASGIADPKKLGVTGVSYGGFMTSWLITQDQRFAAAVSVAPTANHVTQHLLSNIPEFVSLFLGGTYTDAIEKYLQRSPIVHAQNVKTPTLNICGALDRCAPPEEAAQFHRALLGNGVISVLVTYPEEGHGIRNLPAAIDYSARLVHWFHEHMPATAAI